MEVWGLNSKAKSNPRDRPISTKVDNNFGGVDGAPGRADGVGFFRISAD